MATNQTQVASHRLEEARRRFGGLRATEGMVTMDMCHLWCGWLSFEATGEIAILDSELADELQVIVSRGRPEQRLTCETAYYSSVFRDLCDMLNSSLGQDAVAEGIRVFCDAEEHGSYEVVMSGGSISVWSYAGDADEPTEVCRCVRHDGGSYVSDCHGAVGVLAKMILSQGADAQADILDALALFCERVTSDAQGEVTVIDATAQDVATMLLPFVGWHESQGHSS